MSLIKTNLYDQMSDFDESSLQRYEAEQVQLAAEEKEREENPKFYWQVTQKNPKTNEVWMDYCDSEEEAMKLVEEAKNDGYEYEWERYTDIECAA